MDARYRWTMNCRRGFLPEPDPLVSFPTDSDFALLDQIGRGLPHLLNDRGFRRYAGGLKIPHWPDSLPLPEHLPQLRLYYVRLGFLASAYINQAGENGATVLPRNIAVPLAHACSLLARPPVLSYDGYALYNWKRLDPRGPIALGNIDTVQNFVNMADERWYILAHVEVEAIAAEVLAAMSNAAQGVTEGDGDRVDASLRCLEDAVSRQVAVLERIPEKVDPRLCHTTFRPYIRSFEKVVYEGVKRQPMDRRGETGAQSSVLASLFAFLKIPHDLADMRPYMPAEHRLLLDEIEAMPPVSDFASIHVLGSVLDAVGRLREAYGVSDPQEARGSRAPLAVAA